MTIKPSELITTTIHLTMSKKETKSFHKNIYGEFDPGSG